MEVLVLNREQVARCLGMPAAIDLMAEAFASLSSGKVTSPIRTMLSNQAGTVLYKPAHAAEPESFCIKVVSVFPDNQRRELPVTAGLVLVNDAQTGLPVALLEAGYLTSLRTGAATGLATRLLAATEVKQAALFGTGGQAWHQLEAMLNVRRLERVFVYSRQPDRAQAFCDQMMSRLHALESPCELVPGQRSDLQSCGLVTTATTSPEPLFEDGELAREVHINAIGSLGPHRSEIPLATLQRCQLIVDQRAACLQEAGEVQLLMNSGAVPDDFRPPELGELVNADGDSSYSATVFKSVGNAAQDIVCAREIIKTARSQSIGQLVHF